MNGNVHRKSRLLSIVFFVLLFCSSWTPKVGKKQQLELDVFSNCWSVSTTGLMKQCPYFKTKVDELERVQKRATKLIRRLGNPHCSERLKLNLFHFPKTRLGDDFGDMLCKKTFIRRRVLAVKRPFTIADKDIRTCHCWKLDIRHNYLKRERNCSIANPGEFYMNGFLSLAVFKCRLVVL